MSKVLASSSSADLGQKIKLVRISDTETCLTHIPTHSAFPVQLCATWNSAVLESSWYSPLMVYSSTQTYPGNLDSFPNLPNISILVEGDGRYKGTILGRRQLPKYQAVHRTQRSLGPPRSRFQSCRSLGGARGKPAAGGAWTRKRPKQGKSIPILLQFVQSPCSWPLFLGNDRSNQYDISDTQFVTPWTYPTYAIPDAADYTTW